MSAKKYESAFARDKREVTREVDGKQVTVIRFRAVAKYRVANPNYVEKPEGKDTRTATQKRRDVWKQTGTYLEVPKGKGRNAKKQTDTAIANALEAWRAELNEEASKPEEAKQTMVELVRAYVARREAFSNGQNWDTAIDGVVTRSTIRDYRHTIDFLEKSFPNIEVADLETRDFKTWREKQLTAGQSFSRVRKAHVLMKQTLSDALGNEIIKTNVMASLKAPRLPKRQNNALTQEDAQRLTVQLAVLEPSPLVVGAMLALHCGLRGGEVCGLTWGSVDFEGRHLTVKQAVGIADGGKFLKSPKSESGNRTIWMDDYVFDVLKKRKAQALASRDNISKGFEDLFVVGDVDGNYLSPTTLSRSFTSLSRALGLRGKTGEVPTLHKLRHTFADALRGGKGNDKAIRDVMGHSARGTTDEYGTKDQELMDDAVKAAAKWLKPKDSTKAQADVLDFTKTGTEG